MKPYLVTSKFYYDDKLEDTRSYTLLLESQRQAEYSGADFESLWEFTKKNDGVLPLTMYELKNGKRYLEFYYKTFGSIITPKNCKPWKFTITSEETTISMDRLMQFDAEEVIQYLKDRGMTACPILK